MDDQTDGKQTEDALAKCEESVEDLKAENAELRNAAQTFGDLAERLNTKQHLGNDKRRAPRRRRSLPSKGRKASL